MSNSTSKYSEQLIDKICSDMANSPKSIRTCCIENGISYDVFKLWVNEHKKEYKEYALTQYAHAKEEQIQFLSEEITRLTYEMQTLIREGKTYSEFNVNAAVAALRVQIDALKWVLSKLAPKKYGDKVEIDAKVDVAVTGMKIV